MSRPAPVEAARPWAEEWMSIGVTGTNGKTSTVKLIGATLRAAQRPAFTVDTLEYRIDDEVIPVQRTWKGFIGAGREAARRGCRHAVIEVTSHALARGYARRWRYDLGVFTNLAHDHIAAHGSVEHYLAAKAQLFVNLAPGGTAILNAADKAAVMISRVMPADVSRLWYAAAHRGPRLCKADLEAMSIETCLDGTRVTLAPSPAAEAVGGALELQLVGDVFGENALAAALAA
ncbi:MAG: hypothetical protein KC636_32560, partial [Myxococcales bacterium]|nr:hypothetical protein [Myxococcales bacterium]